MSPFLDGNPLKGRSVAYIHYCAQLGAIMADQNLHLRQSLNPKVTQRTVLLGRVKMAQAIQMRESEWARMISEVEGDPLFQDLIAAKVGDKRIVRYKRFSRTHLSGQFYEAQDANVIGGSGESPETLLSRKKHLLELIKRVGQENFERFFLYRDECLPVADLMKSCSISEGEAKALQDFVMEMSVQSEFYHPSSLQPHNMIRPTLVGEIIRNEDGAYSLSYFSPHLARGLYEIDGEMLKKWQKDKKLDRTQSSKIRRYVGLLELSNLKQGAFWRVMEYVLRIQKDYFDTQDISKMAPVSLRHVARTLQFAPSTISRVLSNKSVMLPWAHEVTLLFLMPGQRKVVLTILDKILLQKKDLTDIKLAQEIASSYGIKVSRRTVTACRHVLENRPSAKAA